MGNLNNCHISYELLQKPSGSKPLPAFNAFKIGAISGVKADLKMVPTFRAGDCGVGPPKAGWILYFVFALGTFQA